MDKNQIKILMATINLLRVQLEELLSESIPPTDPEVIKKSQDLDQLIVQYYELLKRME